MPGGIVISLRGIPVRLVLASASSLDELAWEVVVAEVPELLSGQGRDLLAATAGTRDPFRTAARDALARGQRLVDVQALAPRGPSPPWPACRACWTRWSCRPAGRCC